jgi:[ribosomal protein S5]-alanine N-acetyltransferase
MPAANIRLVPHSLEHVRALREGADAYKRCFGVSVADGVSEFVTGSEVSEAFLERLEASTANDPWKDGFGIVDDPDGILIGLCSFSGPPDAEGTVEISYGIAPAYRGRGFATQAAQLLITRARASGRVRTLRAHTLPEHNASTRVLEKCGFTHREELIHPEDGLIWRWELAHELA